ncbi:sialic acid-binding Ig-like lectin 5 [Lepus europaeus]|uniref:sialic acid-binding Ig-like lectin 5 n=1 Tax=Lepus europaeus TaxID=9983 RepID=UPI002B49D103|nr:sialic acid-binding Ig-like lectin 5 [Lepus europaeus]
MLPLLLLPLLWGGSLQKLPGYELQVQQSVTVQEGLCVSVPCSFSYPTPSWGSSSPVYIFWFRNVDNIYYDDPVATNHPQRPVKTEAQGRFHVSSDLRTPNCSLSIRDARRGDTGWYFFRVDTGGDVRYSYTERKLNVRVTALTEKPHVHFPAPLESGRPTQLTCSLPGSCPEGRPLSFSWAGEALGSRDPGTLRSPLLTFTPRPQDHGTSLTCRVNLQGARVTTERTVQLNVSYAPENLTISVSAWNRTGSQILQNGSTFSIMEGQTLRLLCRVDSNPCANLSWFQGSSAKNASPISKTNILELPQVQPEHEGVFTCLARNPLGSLQGSINLSVYYPAQLFGPSCSWEARGLRCSCSSRAWPAPSLRWRLGERLLEGNSSGNSNHASFTITSSSAGPWANSSLSLRGELGSDLRLSCEAWNVHRTHNVTVLLLPGKSAWEGGVVSAALAGAGAMALLGLCLCLIVFGIVKIYRKPAAGRPEGAEDEDPVMGSVTWDSRQKAPKPDGPQEQDPPADAAPLPQQPQELHYASLSFHGMKPREPQDQEATGATEYSEIKKSK